MNQNPNYKLKIVLTLGIITVSLLLINSIFSGTKKLPQLIRSTPTPTVITPPSDTSPSYSNIPPEIKTKFDQIDNYNQTEFNFPPPQIDSKIGSS